MVSGTIIIDFPPHIYNQFQSNALTGSFPLAKMNKNRRHITPERIVEESGGYLVYAVGGCVKQKKSLEETLSVSWMR